MSQPFVDRIEGAFAVVIAGGREKRVRLSDLPAGVREGVYLSKDLKAVDEEVTRRAAEQARSRRDRLKKDDDGGDFSL